MTTESATLPTGSVPLLAMRGIQKAFAGTEVLKGVDFNVRAGEVHALCGENGAGKSTLMNILAGVHRPDSGEVVFGGRNLAGFPSAHAAQSAGVGMVFQERSLFGPLTVAENIFAGRQPITRWGMVNRTQLHSSATELLARVAPDISANATVADLSPAQQQMVEIAKALSLDAKVMIFDEPTAALTQTETKRLFAVIRQLQARDTGIVYITHRLEEIFLLANRVTVLKDGAWQGTLPVKETTTDHLVRRMVGRAIPNGNGRTNDVPRPVLLEVRGLSDAPNQRYRESRVRDVSFYARAGEIVGFAGLAGAGRTEMALALFGARPRGQGEILLSGERVEIRSPAQAIAAGLGYVSEDRKESGLFLDMAVRRNISAARLAAFGEWYFRDAQEAAQAHECAGKLRIACRSIEQDSAHLSGGNQQKVLLARWLFANPRVLVVDEPTRGVDVGAKTDVHQILRAYAANGHAVVVISSELPELLMISDRIYVMRAGRIAGEVSGERMTEENIMRLAAAES